MPYTYHESHDSGGDDSNEDYVPQPASGVLAVALLGTIIFGGVSFAMLKFGVLTLFISSWKDHQVDMAFISLGFLLAGLSFFFLSFGYLVYCLICIFTKKPIKGREPFGESMRRGWMAGLGIPSGEPREKDAGDYMFVSVVVIALDLICLGVFLQELHDKPTQPEEEGFWWLALILFGGFVLGFAVLVVYCWVMAFITRRSK